MRFADPSSVRDEAPAEHENENGPFGTFTAHSSPSPTAEGPDGVDLSFLDPALENGELGRIAHYRILSIIGVGGMGVVLRGEDTHLRRPVALKVMRKEYVESYASRERFLQEARVAAAVESENIVTIYQVGMHNDVPYLAMQFLHGEALDERLNRQVPLPVPFALLVARQTARGLADAHSQGLVHRDVKPANIWLETEPASGKFRRVRLLDFGLARIIDSNRKLTSMGVIVGTPQYMSPEQAFGSEVDGRADLFSLGAVMYAMFTGKLPFEGKTSAATLMSLVSHHPPRVRTLNKQVPVEVDDLIDHLLAKEPEKRPATADEVVEILDSVLIEFSTPILGRTSGVLGYATRGDTLPGPRTTPPPLSTSLNDARGVTKIGPQPTLMLRAQEQAVAPAAATCTDFELATGISGEVTTTLPPKAEEPAVVEPPPPVASPPTASPQPRHPSYSWVNLLGWVALLSMTSLMAFGVIGPNSKDRQGVPDLAPVPVKPQEIHVGMLHAKSGSMAVLEQSQADAATLAIDELNQKGGLLGKKIVPVDVDAGHTPEEYARQAETLIKDRGLTTLFGSPTASDRRAVRPIVERFNAMLFSAGPQEGMEQSSRIVYVGPTASQSTAPAVKHLLAKGSRRVFVIGTDGIFARAMGAVVQDVVKEVPGASLVGEAYVPARNKDFTAAIKEVQAKKPDVIVNAIQGGCSVVFVQQLRAAAPAIHCPILHLQYMEDFHRALDPAITAGDLTVCCYLDGKSEPATDGFAARFRARYGQNRVVTDSMAEAYSAVLLWAKAIEAANSEAPDAVLAALPGIGMDSPLGPLHATETGRHFRLRLYIAEFARDGSLNVVHQIVPLEPQVYPPTRSQADWDRYLWHLSFQWSER